MYKAWGLMVVGLFSGCTKKPTTVVHAVTQAQGGSHQHPEVVFQTTLGTFVVRLDGDKAPVSTANFVHYVSTGFYDGTIFHRVIPDFMVQGGGFDAKLKQKPTAAPIKNEANNGLGNRRGTVAMARTSVIDSATSQFFINVKDNHQLDHTSENFGYAVIGEVIEGMDIVDKIRKEPTLCPSWTGSSPCDGGTLPPGMADVPKRTIAIDKAFVR